MAELLKTRHIIPAINIPTKVINLYCYSNSVLLNPNDTLQNNTTNRIAKDLWF